MIICCWNIWQSQCNGMSVAGNEWVDTVFTGSKKNKPPATRRSVLSQSRDLFRFAKTYHLQTNVFVKIQYTILCYDIRQNRWSTVVRATLKFDQPEVENIAHVTFSTPGWSYFNVALTAVHHLYNVARSNHGILDVTSGQNRLTHTAQRRPRGNHPSCGRDDRTSVALPQPGSSMTTLSHTSPEDRWPVAGDDILSLSATAPRHSSYLYTGTHRQHR